MQAMPQRGPRLLLSVLSTSYLEVMRPAGPGRDCMGGWLPTLHWFVQWPVQDWQRRGAIRAQIRRLCSPFTPKMISSDNNPERNTDVILRHYSILTSCMTQLWSVKWSAIVVSILPVNVRTRIPSSDNSSRFLDKFAFCESIFCSSPVCRYCTFGQMLPCVSVT